ncbi:hypothetical protein CEP54_013620 [Fusarium duplospermum]|uniref:Uncharacterized protein n=1 Tax=Fusarium duplospermum TaxID=1325734 RepID=A0A428P1P7_9HYPO|nr:hypothetical protein CEP54_013620 [Fusarium duplospermum]
MALHELNKRSCTQNEFPSLLKAINCYFPGSDYPTHVYPRVQAQMARLFDRLVARGVVQSIRLESGGWTAKWPCWTKNWLEPDWDGDITLPIFLQTKEAEKQPPGLNSFQEMMEALPIPPPHFPPEAPDVLSIVGESKDVDMPDAPEIITIDNDGIQNHTFSHASDFKPNIICQSEGSVTSFNPPIIPYSGLAPSPFSPNTIPSSTSFDPTLTRFPQTTSSSCTSFNPLFVPAVFHKPHFASASAPGQPNFQPGHFPAQPLQSCRYSSPQQFDANRHQVSRVANVQTMSSNHATTTLVPQAVLPSSCPSISAGNLGYKALPCNQDCSVQTPMLRDMAQQSTSMQLPPIPAQQPHDTLPHQLPSQQHIPLQQSSQQLAQQGLFQQQNSGSLADASSMTSWNPTIIYLNYPESSNAPTVVANSTSNDSYCPTVLGNGNNMSSYCPSIVHKSHQHTSAVPLTQITETEDRPKEPVHQQAPLPTTLVSIHQPLTPAATPETPSRSDRVETWRREVTPLRLFDPVKVRRELYVLISEAKDIKTQIKQAHGQAMSMNLNKAILAIGEMRRKVGSALSSKFHSVLADVLVKPAISDANILKGRLDKVQSEIMTHKRRLISESLGEGKWHGRRHDGASSVDDALWM